MSLLAIFQAHSVLLILCCQSSILPLELGFHPTLGSCALSLSMLPALAIGSRDPVGWPYLSIFHFLFLQPQDLCPGLPYVRGWIAPHPQVRVALPLAPKVDVDSGICIWSILKCTLLVLPAVLGWKPISVCFIELNITTFFLII